MNKKIIILIILSLLSLILSILVYLNYSNSYNNNDKKIISLSKSSNTLKSTQNSMNDLINLILSPILKSLNINDSISLPQNIPFEPVDASKFGGVFTMLVNASNFSVVINNIQNTDIEFRQYYEGKLIFYTDLSCILNIGSLNFTNITLLKTYYSDANFTNVQLPFDMNIRISFDPFNCSNTTINIASLESVFFPDSMKSFWNDYWNKRENEATAAAVALGPTIVGSIYYESLAGACDYVNSIFFNQLNDQANIASKINDQLPIIENSINSIFQSSNFLDICSRYKSIIDSIVQINLNPWDFSTILCNSDMCKSNAHHNYLIATTDTPFPNTNFSSDQIYIIKSDFSTCYAVNMKESNLDLIQHMFPPISRITGTQPASVLLKTNDPDGKVIVN